MTLRARSSGTEPAHPAEPDPDLAEIVRAAQADLDHAIQVSGLQNDPLRYVFRALSVFLSALHKMLIAFISQLAAARQPVRDDVLRDAMIQGVHGHASGVVRALNIRNWLIGAVALFAAFLIGAGSGYWYRGTAPFIIGVRAAPEKCDDRADGSRVCYIPIYERLPRTWSQQQ